MRSIDVQMRLFIVYVDDFPGKNSFDARKIRNDQGQSDNVVRGGVYY